MWSARRGRARSGSVRSRCNGAPSGDANDRISAIRSISTRASLGSRAAWMVARAGAGDGEVGPVDLVHRRRSHSCRPGRPSSRTTRSNEVPAASGCREVPEDAVRLRRDVAVDQRAGRRVERDLTRDEEERAGADGLGVRADRRGGSRRGDGLAASRLQAALTTLPERRQRVQTRSRRMPPLTSARTRCRFGSNRRGRHVVRVTDVPAHDRALTADFATFCHGRVSLSSRCNTGVVRLEAPPAQRGRARSAQTSELYTSAPASSRSNDNRHNCLPV